MPYTPEIRLAPRHAVNTQPHRDAQRVNRIQKRRDNAITRLHPRAAEERPCHELRVPRLEVPVGPDVEVYADVGETEEGAGREGDGPVLVVWVEA